MTLMNQIRVHLWLNHLTLVIKMPVNPTIAAYKRSVWKPLVAMRDGPLAASKFSGTPWLDEGEAWPQCPNCNRHLQLFLQLNLDELPKPLMGKFGDGIIQLFYCTTQEPQCEVECEAFFPFARSVLVRLIPKKAIPSDVAVPPVGDIFPARTIIGWREDDDYPNWEEGETLGIELEESEWEQLSEEDFPRSGDKLAGWPHWVQSLEYPNCPDCGNLMRLVFQIDSNDNLPYDFGDVGCGHITQCETHKERLAFGWACG
jgi:uncharacterized protein YwqG